METTCPYCEHEQEQEIDFEIKENEVHTTECHECEKSYTYSISVMFSTNTEKADCLNEGGQHLYRPTTTFPKCFTKMRCETCYDERHPTEEERAEHKIPTFWEYSKELEEGYD